MAIHKTHPDEESHEGTVERGKRPCPRSVARDDLVLALLWTTVGVGLLMLAVFAVLKFR